MATLLIYSHFYFDFLSASLSEYHNDHPKVKDYSEEYHAVYHETVWSILKARPFLWSTYVWNMFDFGANIRNEGGVKGRNNKGLVTYDRKIKKDAFYLYKAHWSDEKFVHITSKRYVHRHEDTLNIKVYSNLNEVVLVVDGVTYTPTSVDDVIYVFEGIKFTSKTMNVVAQAFEDDVRYADFATFKLGNQPLSSYKAPEESGGFAANWFASPKLDNVTIEQIEFKEGYCSSKMSLKALFANERAAVVIRKYLKGMEDNPMIGMMMGMTLETMADLASDKLTPTLLYLINKELVEIKK